MLWDHTQPNTRISSVAQDLIVSAMARKYTWDFLSSFITVTFFPLRLLDWVMSWYTYYTIFGKVFGSCFGAHIRVKVLFLVGLEVQVRYVLVSSRKIGGWLRPSFGIVVLSVSANI
jgi:hypothetical protein